MRRPAITDKALIVGLGNPGPKYANNRHNVGFQVADMLAARHGMSFSQQRNKALIAAGLIGGRAVVLAKPQTYMNKSGGPVGALVRFYKLDPANLLVVGDHLDLEAGTLRMRPSGGSGGLNGIKDIIRHLGTEEFARLRIGIGRPPGKMDPAAYVLQDFKGDEIALFKEVRERAADAIESWLTEGIELAMSRHNGPITL